MFNGGGGYGFYFKANTIPLPGPVVAALKVESEKRTDDQKAILRQYYLGFAPELESVRKRIGARKDEVARSLQQWEADLNQAPKPQSLGSHRQEAQKRFDEALRNKMRAQTFKRVPASSARQNEIGNLFRKRGLAIPRSHFWKAKHRGRRLASTNGSCKLHTQDHQMYM